MNDQYHYSVLGLTMNASQTEINKAWKNLALIYHPDKTKLNKVTASEKFIKIEKSYQYLKSQNEIAKEFSRKIDKIVDSQEFDKQFEKSLINGYQNITQQRQQHQSVLNLLSSLNKNFTPSTNFQKNKQKEHCSKKQIKVKKKQKENEKSFQNNFLIKFTSIDNAFKQNKEKQVNVMMDSERMENQNQKQNEKNFEQYQEPIVEMC